MIKYFTTFFFLSVNSYLVVIFLKLKGCPRRLKIQKWYKWMMVICLKPNLYSTWRSFLLTKLRRYLYLLPLEGSQESIDTSLLYDNFIRRIKEAHHRLKMELDLQSLFGLYSCTHWLRPRNTPPPPFLRIWAHVQGRYWSARAKIDDIALWPLPEAYSHAWPLPWSWLPPPPFRQLTNAASITHREERLC